MLRVVAHGGTGSSGRDRDGTQAAADAGLAMLRADGPVAAVVEAVRRLEDDERFNAGTGAHLRLDGKTIELDAAVTREDGAHGAVACIQAVRNPVLVAERLMHLPTNLLMGDAATAFARRIGLPPHDPATPRARRAYDKLVRQIRDGKAARGDNLWHADALRAAWNYGRPFDEVFPDGFPATHDPKAMRAADTVGAVATDGERFAAAASTGGTTTTLRGRIGDTPILGAGLLANRSGAVACTGLGDRILADRTASRVGRWLEDGVTPEDALERAKARFPAWADLGLAIVTAHGFACGSNRGMAWSVAEGER